LEKPYYYLHGEKKMKFFSKEKSAEKWQRNEVKMKEKEQMTGSSSRQASGATGWDIGISILDIITIRHASKRYWYYY